MFSIQNKVKMTILLLNRSWQKLKISANTIFFIGQFFQILAQFVIDMSGTFWCIYRQSTYKYELLIDSIDTINALIQLINN